MADLDFNIKGNNEKFIKDVEQIRSSIQSITIELKNASNESNGFTNVLKKTFDMLGGKEALKEFVSDVVRVRGEYQQLGLSFSTLLQNKGEADNLMSQMMRSAAETPFSLTELAAEAKQLIGYGVASEEVNETLLQLGEIAAGVGAPLEQITSD
nr:MAG TPA: Tape measure domain protein [Caudoviricetes sp.]